MCPSASYHLTASRCRNEDDHTYIKTSRTLPSAGSIKLKYTYTALAVMWLMSLLKSECGTWSHAVISSLGAQARGGVVGRRRSMSHVVRPGLEQTTGMSHRDGFRQPYSNFSNRPYPLAQNRGTILMGIVLRRVTENSKIAILGFGPNLTFPKKGSDLDIRPSGGNSGWHGWMRRQKLV